ncbi:hypothetical protein PsorP6_008110 [Peronosclerospora sorghi]|uniref:Uncharacterized protein n=1 Tax=Peronosclerospora sorghi TaxID=230839 RepID=A0ACC0W948_9STRA|nr:hypothetical protein PsorP6_008110 [Peronosclerospora sorghi]
MAVSEYNISTYANKWIASHFYLRCSHLTMNTENGDAYVCRLDDFSRVCVLARVRLSWRQPCEVSSFNCLAFHLKPSSSPPQLASSTSIDALINVLS